MYKSYFVTINRLIWIYFERCIYFTVNYLPKLQVQQTGSTNLSNVESFAVAVTTEFLKDAPKEPKITDDR